MPLHMHPYYRETFGCQPSDCPHAAEIYPELISLPLYPDLTAQEIERVSATLKEIIAGPTVPGVDLEPVEQEA
jgi:perosamine synthetase